MQMKLDIRPFSIIPSSQCVIFLYFDNPCCRSLVCTVIIAVVSYVFALQNLDCFLFVFFCKEHIFFSKMYYTFGYNAVI